MYWNEISVIEKTCRGPGLLGRILPFVEKGFSLSSESSIQILSPSLSTVKDSNIWDQSKSRSATPLFLVPRNVGPEALLQGETNTSAHELLNHVLLHVNSCTLPFFESIPWTCQVYPSVTSTRPHAIRTFADVPKRPVDMPNWSKLAILDVKQSLLFSVPFSFSFLLIYVSFQIWRRGTFMDICYFRSINKIWSTCQKDLPTCQSQIDVSTCQLVNTARVSS